MEIVGVAKSVLRYLRAHIITQDFAPGQKLTEVEIASRLGVSRPPIREAFRILENEHLVSSTPRIGCFVTPMSVKDCRDIYKVRTMIECFAVDEIESKEIKKLDEVRDALEATAELPPPRENDAFEKYEYLRAIAEFHIRLVELSGNTRLVELYKAIFPSLARYQSLYTYIPGLMDESYVEHKDILRLIDTGEYHNAKERLKTHINKFIEIIKDRLQEPGELQQEQSRIRQSTTSFGG